MILILILASLLRFHGLSYQSLWDDELSSWSRSHYNNLSTVINKGVVGDMHPPGYHTTVYFVEKYIGESEFDLRLPSAISGILSVLVIFLIGARLYSYKEGLISSVLMAVLWCPIYYSQEGRPYSMLLLSTLLATYFWVRILLNLNEEKKISVLLGSGYVISAALASYLHYYGLFLIILQGLWGGVFFVRKPKALLDLLVIYFFILLAYAPWLPFMAHHLRSDNVTDNIGWIAPPGNIIHCFINYLKFLFNNSLKTVILVLGMYAFLIFHTVKNYNRSNVQKNAKSSFFPTEILLFSWLLVPFLISYLKSIVSYPVLVNKVLIISLPAAYLLFSRAITQLFVRPRYQIIITVIILVYSIHWLISDKYYSTPTKEQWREAAYFIADNDKQYKNSLIIGYSWKLQYFDYYLERRGSDNRAKIMAGYDTDIPKIADAINKENPEYVWYIYGQRKPDPGFIDFMKKRLLLIKEKKFIETGVYLFRNPGPVNKVLP